MGNRSIKHVPWPKTARPNRAVTITEKIDGTNAAVGIRYIDTLDHIKDGDGAITFFDGDAKVILAFVNGYAVFAQSRNRLITPGKGDNAGFAGWVQENAEALVETLGQGLHYGEWWGPGIQRGYAQTVKRFSLFDPRKRRAIDAAIENGVEIPTLDVVPVLYEGQFTTDAINQAMRELTIMGSSAAPGFYHPEGIIVFHHALGVGMEVLVENDHQPKSVAEKETASA